MRSTLISILALALFTVAGSAAAPAPKIPLTHVPAPVFDDPIWHGASDPTIIWNPAANLWFMYYTQRRSTLQPTHGVDWVHGTAIGIATSPDGTHWKYKGICRGEDNLGDPMKARCSWWAPCVVEQDGVFHMFVSWVDGIYTTWKGHRLIKHFTSTDGIHWAFVNTLDLSSKRVIDPCVLKIDGLYRLWYKDEADHSHIHMVSSADLTHWNGNKTVITGVGQEAPFVWKWKGRYFLMTDRWGDSPASGLRVYESPTGLGDWTLNTILLQKAGTRHLDNGRGFHPFVLKNHGRVLLYYFVQYHVANDPYHGRRSVIQLAELHLGPDGKVTCDRNP